MAKIRIGFVSNSSSSSFVCDFCGREESGYDLALQEAEMCECEHGHTFCEHEIVGELEIDDDNDMRYYISEKHCPVCNRAKELEKDPLYQQYKELFEHFKGIAPDGSLA